MTRFTRTRSCSICGGYENAPRGGGTRCWGFLSDDSQWAHCTRPEHAGGIEKNPSSSTYPHKLARDCACGVPHEPVATAPAATAAQERGRVVAAYDYRDEHGRLLFQAIRLEPKDFRQRQPDGHGDWIWNLKGVRRVLYQLPELLAADPAASVLVVEGEKDADNLAARGLVATTNAGGAGKWRPEYSEALQGRHVVVLPDNDESGRQHAEQVATSLRDIAASVKIVELPDLPAKGDVSDWLAAGGTGDKLRALAEAAPGFVPRLAVGGEAGRNGNAAVSDEPRWRPKPLSALSAEGTDVPWLFDGYVARRSITLFTGLWKAGKTTFVAHLLGAMGADEMQFAGRDVSAAKVLVVTEESEQVWAGRRDALALGDHVWVISRPFLSRADSRAWHAFVEHLAGIVEQQGIEVVIFDSLPNLWPVKDENAAPDVLAALAVLHRLTNAGAAVLLIAHPRKGDAGEGQATRGSGAVGGFVDIIVEMRRFDRERRDDTRRVLTAYSRYDETPAELVVEYDPNSGYRPVGTKVDAGAEDRRRVAYEVLNIRGGGLTAKDILHDWPSDAGVVKPGERTLRRDLDGAFKAGRLHRTGGGKKNDPHRYYWVEGAEPPMVATTDSFPASSIPDSSLVMNPVPGPANDGSGEEVAEWTA